MWHSVQQTVLVARVSCQPLIIELKALCDPTWIIHPVHEHSKKRPALVTQLMLLQNTAI